MAITIIGKPDDIHPGYNPVVYYIDSDNKALPSFRYIIQIFDAGTSNLLREFKVAPRPGDGYGYLDISKILQNKLSNTKPFQVGNFTSGDNGCIYNYDIKFGEEYTLGQITTTTQPITFSPNPTTYAQIFFLNPHPFVVGDQIQIVLPSTYGDCRDGLNGFFTVLSTSTTDRLTTNYITSCTSSLSISGGIVSYADNRKIRVLDLNSESNRIVFNRAYSFTEFLSYDMNDILIFDEFSKIITNAPRNGFTIYPFQKLWWNFFDNQRNTAKCILFKNDTGDLFRLNANSTLDFIKMVNVSPDAVKTLISGTSPLVKPTTKYYDVWSTDDCECDLTCDAINITYTISGNKIRTQADALGTYNGANYYEFDGFYMWYSSSNNEWNITNALGGGTDYLVSDTIVILDDCYYGGLLNGWYPGGTSIFTEFETFACTLEGYPTSEKIRIYINNNCAINDIQILFMDRSGSWSSFGFTLRYKKSGTINKDTYRKEIGYLDSGKFTYDSYDKGLTNYNIDVTETYTLNTDWMNDSMSVYFTELLSSPETYIKFGDSELWLSCNILEGSYKEDRSKDKILIKKTIDVKLSNDIPINI